MSKKLWLLPLVLLAVCQMAWGQSRTISGKITDADGTLPGVSVLLKGTASGTVTDSNGEYRLSVPGDDAVLVVSSIGYIVQEIIVGARTSINIVLLVDVSQLQEVVVTGYGTQVKRNVTGAISTVRGDALTKMPTPSFDMALQGQAAGVQVSQSGGVPGSPVRVMIRGTSSISSGSEPLWIVDGMPITNPIAGVGANQGFGINSTALNPLASINPNDIESVEVLKDAAATAIYGSRGSNGVIIVTTKSGKSGAPARTSIDFQRGVTTMIRKPEDIGFVDGSTWLGLVDEARANSGLGPFDVNQNLNQGRDPNAMLDRSQYANTNWFDPILQTGSFTDLNISSQKGFDKGGFFLSGQYRDDEGVMVGNRFQRWSVRANVDYEPFKNMKVGTRISGSYVKNARVKQEGGGAPGGNVNTALGGFGQANSGAIPILPIYHPTRQNPDGSPAFFDPLSGNNLVASLDRNNMVDQGDDYRMLGGIFAEYSLPWVKGLSVRTEYSLDYFQNTTLFWANTNLRLGSAYAFQDQRTGQNKNYNLYATYNRAFGDHNFNAVFGTESQSNIGTSMFIEGDQLQGVQQQVGGPGNPIRLGGTLGNGERYLRGVFGRANYIFKDRYMLGASLRRDGSSVFEPENRYGVFTAFSAGWIISSENFMADLSFVELLKLRGSFGQTGNQNIPAGLEMDAFTGWSRYGSRGNLVGAGDNLSGIGVSGITWETTDAVDVGLDYSLFGGRVSGSVGYYRQLVSDMLLQVPIAPSSGPFSGGPSIWGNIGDMLNHGMEFDFNTVNVDKGGFKWTTNFNFTTNRNEILALADAIDNAGAGINSGNTITRKGGILGAMFLARYAGINQENGVEMIVALDRPHFAETGQYRPLTDANGNQVLIPASRANVQNNRFLEDKSGIPKFFGGINNTFSYKGFDMTVMMSFMGGHYIYDQDERAQTTIGVGNRIYRQDLVGNHWTPQNPNAKYPQLRWNDRYDINNDGNAVAANSQRYDLAHPMDRYLYKGDFLRLRTLQIGYTIPNEFAAKAFLQNARVYLTGTNLFTFRDQNFNGYDPEMVNFAGGSQVRNLQQGFLSARIPQLRTFNFGISASF